MRSDFDPCKDCNEIVARHKVVDALFELDRFAAVTSEVLGCEHGCVAC